MTTSFAKSTPMSEENEPSSNGSANTGDSVPDDGGRGPSQATLLVELCEGFEFFHDPNGDAYVRLPVNGHFENRPVKSSAFKEYLGREFYSRYGKAVGAQPLSDTLNVLAARGKYDGPALHVYVRVAPADDAVYIDLGDPTWRAVHITAAGWAIVNDPPVRFRRPKGLLALPEPVRGGSVDELRPLVNVKGDDDWIMFVAHLVGSLNPKGPFAACVLQGEQGSTKTSAARAHRRLIDPCFADLRRPPKNEEDLMIAATNGWVVAYDNLSGLTRWMSDALCSLATGAGMGTRELYSNGDEALFQGCRPILLNGIEDIAVFGDLADRAVTIEMPPMPRAQRMDERTYWARFESVRPRVLGALYDAVAAAIRNLDTVRLAELPRMADFAKWVTAAESGLGWAAGTFMTAYTANASKSADVALNADPVSAAVIAFMEGRTIWTGSPTQLHAELTTVTPEQTRRSREWPKAANALSGRLRRAVTFLRAIGIEVESERKGHAGSRILNLRRAVVPTVSTVSSEGPIAPSAAGAGGYDADDRAAETPSTDGADTHTQGVAPQHRQHGEGDPAAGAGAADGADDVSGDVGYVEDVL